MFRRKWTLPFAIPTKKTTFFFSTVGNRLSVPKKLKFIFDKKKERKNRKLSLRVQDSKAVSFLIELKHAFSQFGYYCYQLMRKWNEGNPKLDTLEWATWQREEKKKDSHTHEPNAKFTHVSVENKMWKTRKLIGHKSVCEMRQKVYEDA